jgi:hypothetical protein
MLPSVRERGETIATLRWIHVRLMETIASWVPTTPEMEVKLLLGAHIWDVAQHADALGKRTFELRMPLQHSIEPSEPYRQFLAGLAHVQDTAERLGCFYDGILVALAARYRHYLDRTDSLLDAPTVRILEHIGREQGRMIAESQELRRELPALALTRREPVDTLLAREAGIDSYVVHRAEPAVAGVS